MPILDKTVRWVPVIGLAGSIPGVFFGLQRYFARGLLAGSEQTNTTHTPGDQATDRAPVKRYQRDTPGELIHVDIKKTSGIPDGGYRVTAIDIAALQETMLQITGRVRLQ